MKAFRSSFNEDFGKEWHIIVGEIGKWCLFQVFLTFSDDTGMPYAQFSFGAGQLVGFLGWAGPVGIEIGLITKTFRG